ncbi:hypothetical protein CSKR_109070 [Clonorchis sinensis]|uniref:Uncharacterized protein n=1 Tax=Clonorchis sinensis TaxID=79923 RepID=A0A3R7EV97_CLOSI|nr:hypothetical protein CSKR_109070 [Clonorchis sinensis]
MRCTKAASCYSWYDIRDTAVSVLEKSTHKVEEFSATLGVLEKEIDTQRSALICIRIWFCERLTWNSAESLVYDVSKQLSVLHQAMFQLVRYSRYRDTCRHVIHCS